MIRILLVDDQAIIREALKVLLEQEQDFEIVGTANDGQAAIERVEALHPDIALIDIVMPKMDGIAATQIIAQQFPETRVIVLSSNSDDKSLATALQAGAKGYLLKDTQGEDLANTIRSVYRGHGQLGPGLFEKMVARMTAPVESASLAEPELLPNPTLSLSDQEFQTLVDGFDVEALPRVVNQAIAQETSTDLLIRLGHYLKEHPSNPAVLYLSGALLHRTQGRKKAGFQYLGFGFKEASRQEMPTENLLLFYQEAARIQPEAAFSWLTQAKSPWLRDSRLTVLFNEANRLFGSDSIHYRALLALQQIRRMQALNTACVALKPKLDLLQQGFQTRPMVSLL